MSKLLDRIGFEVATKHTRMTPEEFKYLRERLGVSRQDLAGRLGASRQAVRYWETGERPVGPHKEVLLRILFLQKAGRTSQGTVEAATTAPFEAGEDQRPYRIVLDYGGVATEVA